MKLPNAERAVVDSAKLEKYLLNEAHQSGGSKAKFLLLNGYTKADAENLKANLLALAQEENVKEIIETTHGTKFIVMGSFLSPTNRVVSLRTIWIIDNGKTFPRFVTAYPE